MTISRCWLEEQIDRDILQRGEILFQRGQVQKLERLEQDQTIKGAVKEHGNKLFSIYIELRDTEVDGDCSCSVGYNCEHVAALLYALLEARTDQQPNEPPGQPRQAIDISPTSAQPRTNPNALNQQPLNAYPADVQQRILYLLQPVSPPSSHLCIHVVSAKLLSDGSYSATAPYLLSHFFTHIQHRFIQPIDNKIITQVTEPDAVGNIFLVAGSEAATVITLMLKTGRCHWLDATQSPLSLGKADTGHWFWHINANAIQQLSLQVDHAQANPAMLPASYLLPSSPPFFINAEGSHCSPIKSLCPEERYEALLFFRPISPKEALPLEGLCYDWPAGLAQPEQLHIRHIDIAPQPLLRLLPHHQLPYLNGLQLRFDYGGHLTTATTMNDQTIYYQHQGQWRTSHCDRNIEQAFIQQLLEKKLYRNPFHRQHFNSDPEHLPDWRIPAKMGWPQFLSTLLPELSQAGFKIETMQGFDYQIVQVRQWDVSCKERGIMGEIHFEVVLEDGLHIDLIEVIATWIKADPERLSKAMLTTLATQNIQYLSLEDGRILPIAGKVLHGILSAMLDIFSLTAAQQPLIPAMQWVALHKLLSDTTSQHPYIHIQDDAAWRERMQQLTCINEIPTTPPPSTLTVTLRDYQQQGFNWLQNLRRLNLSALLADDMGLGKTIQTLAHILKEKECGKLQHPALVIAPTSLMHNWKAEAARFTPALKVLLLHGTERKKDFPSIDQYDLVLTTYGLLRRDAHILKAQHWSLLILDEAQQIRNASTAAARMARELEADQRICLTGTPIENHLGELWTLFDFLMPAYLNDSRSFNRLFRKPIEQEGDSERQALLNLRIRPFMLRRNKDEVATELPAKSEIIRSVVMEEEQRELYEGVRLLMHKKVRTAMHKMGSGKSTLIMLDALLKMRQVCCDPRLLHASLHKQLARRALASDSIENDSTHQHKLLQSIDQAGSAKIELLREMLPEMISEGRRILLFSQFTQMLKLIASLCDELSIPYLTLTGATRDREIPVQAFQNHQAPLFLISLKAGGVGLNLTAADTVIHYDPWWNPAAEAQASDRAHRIGQKKPVFIYKLVTQSSVESRILDMQQRKKHLAEQTYRASKETTPVWSSEELALLFAPIEES
ncbi:MAG: DEAD/DEAH box helicase [Mariprofundus sp.]|nr:DEAD/DEAH box helicase [Mariprofundus sp.]